MKALVLSAGGAFGAYQIGAWLALKEKNWEPDVVVGTSIGAINGFAICRAYRDSELLHFWQTLPAEIWRSNSKAAQCHFWGQTPLFRSWVHEIFRCCAGYEPLRELHITMAELPSCAMRVVRGTEITEQHLLAACALPGVMWPVRLEGSFYVDGGTFYPLPLQEALATGATEVVAIDLLAVSPCRPVRMGRLAVLWLRNLLRGESTNPTQVELAGVDLQRISQPRTLGSLSECFRWDRSRVDALIESGYRDACEILNSPD